MKYYMKHFAFILMVSTIISCSNDDSSKLLIPSDEKLLLATQGISGNDLTWHTIKITP